MQQKIEELEDKLAEALNNKKEVDAEITTTVVSAR